jgi:hypothetical protein
MVAFARTWEGRRVVVVANGGDADRRVRLTLGGPNQPVTVLVLGSDLAKAAEGRLGRGGEIDIDCPRLEARFLVVPSDSE